jgi:hypothetical protein
MALVPRETDSNFVDRPQCCRCEPAAMGETLAILSMQADQE